jgi:methylaspartate mutase sigma subunit
MPDAPPNRPVTIVTGVIGDDIHVVGLRILEYALRAGGFTVVSLGPLASQREFIDAAIETAADALFISSLNGHGETSLMGLREACVEAGIGDIVIYAGGQLTIRQPEWSAVWLRFVGELGLTRVFPPETDPEVAMSTLREDLAARQQPPAASGTTTAGSGEGR